VKAALVSEPNVISVVDVPDPASRSGQVIVGVEATSICGSDLNGFLGINPRNRLPNILGHEIAGTVVAAGDDASGGLIGQRVVVEPNVSCRTCEWCRAGLPNVCDTYRVLGESMDVPGGLAEFVGVAADQVYPLPDHVPAAEGAVIQPLSVCYHGVVNRAQVAADETVVVLGAGAIGLGCLLMAKWRGARVIVTDVSADRLEFARRLGADETLAADRVEIGPTVRELTSGRGADVTLEAVGGGQDRTIADAVAATSTRGRIVIVGTFGKQPQRIPGYFFKNHEQTMMGAHGHPNAFGPTIELVANGSIKPGELITHRFGLADVADAFRLLGERADGVVKVVIEQ
jgi:threonine dehydrogenase-like Zn-dependent dehydrogenase